MWLSAIQKAIDYIENNLLENFSPADVADESAVSSLYLQKGFTLAVGISMGEYIRNRRLYLAGLDIIGSMNSSITEIALKYGYETPESFSKAFYRFHGMNPRSIRKNPERIRKFFPIKLEVKINGGFADGKFSYSFARLSSFKILGIKRTLSWENFLAEISSFYNELDELNNDPKNAAIKELHSLYRIGEFSLTVDNKRNGYFDYLIGSISLTEKIPEEFTVVEVPSSNWIKFSAHGKLPDAIQKLNEAIFTQWIPSHPEYKIDSNYLLEHFHLMNLFSDQDSSCHEVWVPYSETE